MMLAVVKAVASPGRRIDPDRLSAMWRVPDLEGFYLWRDRRSGLWRGMFLTSNKSFDQPSCERLEDQRFRSLREARESLAAFLQLG